MNLKLTAKTLILILITSTNVTSYCYSQESVMQVFDEVARTSQLYGKADSLFSFCMRPNYALSSFDSLLKFNGQKKFELIKGPGVLKDLVLLPVIFHQQYNTHHAYGWNDGSMIPAKGYQNQLSFGFSWKKGIVSVKVRPEIVYTYNAYFSTFPFNQIENVWYSYHELTNIIDAPERFGYGRYFKFFPGQSHIKVTHRKLSLGVSTENLWWGPGIRNSLLMSNNAPGFPHISFSTATPISSPIGSFEWQLISGLLKGSNIVTDDTSRRINGRLMYQPKQFKTRYINGAVMVWQPKWTKGLFLGFSRVFYQYLSDVKPTLDGYVPVAGKFFKKRIPSEDVKKRDQLLSFFFRLNLPKEKAELYAEFGRNDHSYNSTDFFLQPEHSRAYIIGFSKIFDKGKKDLQLFGEIANLQKTSTMLIREGQSWYVHYQIKEGYTHQGQVIGAGIGPGGSSQTLGLRRISGFDREGITFERQVHNNDFYYIAFAPMGAWQKNWVDLSIHLSKSWHTKRMVYNAQLSWIRSINYQWYYDIQSNISGRVGFCYLL